MNTALALEKENSPNFIIFMNYDTFRDICFEIYNSKGDIHSTCWEFYNDNTVMGMPVYTVTPIYNNGKIPPPPPWKIVRI